MPTSAVRERVVVALANVIEEVGYAPSRVRDVARGARVSLSTFYLAFGSKDECVLALAATAEQAARDWCAARPSAGAEHWRAAVEASIEEALHLALARPRLAYALIVELGGLDHPARQARLDGLDAVAHGFIGIVARARGADAAGVPQGRALDHAQAAFIVGGLVEGLIDLIVEGTTGEAADARVRELADVAGDITERLLA